MLEYLYYHKKVTCSVRVTTSLVILTIQWVGPL